jgi:hypothetical protein
VCDEINQKQKEEAQTSILWFWRLLFEDNLTEGTYRITRYGHVT